MTIAGHSRQRTMHAGQCLPFRLLAECRLTPDADDRLSLSARQRGVASDDPQAEVSASMETSGCIDVPCCVRLVACMFAGDQAPSEQLDIRNGEHSAAGDGSSRSQLPDGAAQTGGTAGAGVATPNAAATAAAGGASMPGTSVAGTGAGPDARVAFQRRVHEHFSRLMAGRGMAPAAVAAQALKSAAGRRRRTTRAHDPSTARRICIGLRGAACLPCYMQITQHGTLRSAE